MLKQITVDVTGTEWDFVSELISQFEACGIECITDKTELQTAMQSATGDAIPIIFQYRSFLFRLTRAAAYSSATSYYTLSCTNENGTLFYKNISFMSGQSPINTIINRKLIFNILLKEQFLSIIFYGYNDLFAADLFFAEIRNSPCYAYSDNESICAADGSIIDMASGATYNFSHALPFAHSDFSKLYILKGKRILSGTTLADECPSLIDCTSITPRSIVTIENKNYYALTKNTLIEV